MKRCNTSIACKNIVHVTNMHVYAYNVQLPCAGLRSTVGSASGCKSRGSEFKPGHITFNYYEGAQSAESHRKW